MNHALSYLKPIPHLRLESVAVRVAFAWILWSILPDRTTMQYTEQPRPNGLADTFSSLDFTFLANPDPVIFEWPAYSAMRALAALALLVYAAGFIPTICLSYVLGFMVCIGTLANSQGSIGHHFQLVAMVLTGITVYHFYYRVRYWKKNTAPDLYQRTLQIGQQLIVAAYVSSAISKSTQSGFFGWIGKTVNFPVALTKTERVHYYNELTDVDTRNLPAMESLAHYLGELLINNPGLGPFIIGPGIVIEGFAFLLLLGRKWNTFGAVAVIAFHLFIGGIMSLHFEMNIKLIAAFFILPNVLYWAYGRYQKQPLSASTPQKA